MTYVNYAQKAADKLQDLLTWVRECGPGVDPHALNKSAWEVYRLAFSAYGSGVLGYGKHTHGAGLRVEAVAMLREAMCLMRYKMTFEDVATLDQMLPAKLLEEYEAATYYG